MTFNAGIEAAALNMTTRDDLVRQYRAFNKWFAGEYSDPDGKFNHLPTWMKNDLRNAWLASAHESQSRPSSSAPVEQREAVARDAKLLAICRVLKPSIFARGLQPLEKDGPVTRATIENTVHNANKILDAILSLPGSPRDEVRCFFCRKTIGDDDEAITDDNGEIACKACGESEFKAQAEEANETALKSGAAK